MKEFLKNKKVTYNLMSFTGFKALVLFSLLMEAPRSYEEICDYFLNHPYLREKIAIDTLRVYLTSFKRAGCAVKRERINGVSKYSIVSNPFELMISPAQLASLVRVYRIISKDLSVEELLEVELFFEKLSKRIKNPEVLDSFKKYSLLKGVNLNLLKDLLNISAKKEQIVIVYKSPRSGEKPIEIVTSKVGMENNKIYLYGYSIEYEKEAYYPISRIVKVQEIKLRKDSDLKLEKLTVGYEYLGDISTLELKDNEQIVSQDNGRTIIEITSSNEFMITQRLLGLTNNAKILYPGEYQEAFITRLKNLKAGYYIG